MLRIAHARRQGAGGLSVQPDAVAHVRGQLPSLGQALADDHVIQADHRALDICDVSTKQLCGFDHTTEALG